MGIFNLSSPFDADIEKATSENNTSEQWGAIMDVCDKVGSSAANAKDALRSIVKRLSHADPHVVVQAITLLDACVNNCGNNFHLEVASRDFENEYRRLLSKSQPAVALKLKQLLKKWSEGEFKSDPQLNLIPSLYNKLKSEGFDFSDVQSNTPKQHPVSKDPNVVSSQQEEDDIAKAIELSLKDKSNSVRPLSSNSASSSLYPSMQLSAPMPSTSNNSEPRKVRALYDFEAAEDNELTFLAGEIIHMLDDSDPNWWKGYNQHGEGLFPANFVTADLSVEPEQFRIDANKKSVQFSDAVQVKTISQDDETSPEINEESIDTLLNLLHEANPEDPNDDTEQMLNLEIQVNKMGPLIDAELENIDRKHAQLTQLSGDLVEALNLYHTLMREPERPQMHNMYGPQGFPNITQQQMFPPRDFMPMPTNSMGMNMPVYAMGPQILPPGMVASGQMNMSLPPVIGITAGNPQISQNNPQPHSLNTTMAQTSPMPQGSVQRVPPNNPHVNLHNMNTNPVMIPNQTILNQSQPQMQLIQNNSQMSLANPNNSQPIGQPQPGPNPMLIHQMSQHLNGLHITNGMGTIPASSHSNPNDETQQSVQYQQRMGSNIFMQGPQALPGHM